MKAMFHLPDLGENIEAGDVVNILIKAGDDVTLDQPLLELETDKAVLEVPAGFAGRVVEILVKDGDRLAVGAAVLSYEAAEESAGAKAPVEEQELAPVPVAPAATVEAPKTDAEPETKAEALPETEVSVIPVPVADNADTLPVPASPTVRRLARELGVNIRKVRGKGPGGRISRDDVKQHVKELLSSSPVQSGGEAGSGLPGAELPDFTRYGEVERVPFSNVRRATAKQMSRAWLHAPRVTQQDKADITQIEAYRRELQPKLAKSDANAPRLTMTAILIRILAQALRRFPQFNASIDMDREELILKQYCHVGVAVDTERGLLVPVIRDADSKGILEIAQELTELSARARDRKAGLDELQGGCITLTNLGGIGGTFFTPIVNHPEVAILGVARASLEPVWNKDTAGFEPRLMLPLGLSYDHRVIDGADGARFTRWICEALQEPLQLLL